MPRGKSGNLLNLFAAFALLAAFSCPAAAAVSKTSKRIIRAGVSASDFSAAALSTTSIQWGWSTGTFTDPGITEYRLYTASAGVVESEYWSLTPGTSYFIDTGLGVNKVYTRWLRVYEGVVPGSDSEHIAKYTHALPPDDVSVGLVIATQAYVSWYFSTATAYAIETSSDTGATYQRNRDSFVPWQTIQLLSNKQYRIRLGAVNGDDELNPVERSSYTQITTYPLDPVLTAVAVSSWSIQWQWSTATFTGTGISGYNLYFSSVSEAEIPIDFTENVVLRQTIGAADTASWTETFIDSQTAVANSSHARWLRAYGYLESIAIRPIKKYTYAIAPEDCTSWYPNELPVSHMEQTAVGLDWNIGWSTTTRNGIASQFFIERSTFHITEAYALELASEVAGGAPYTVEDLIENTKYDFRVGAINGDGESTPNNADNLYAYSDVYRAMTRPAPPSNFDCEPLTDTALECTWSTTTTTINPEFIYGYGVGGRTYGYWNPLDYVPGILTHEYRLDYLMTNSTHTAGVFTRQTDPDWGVLHSSAAAWYYDRSDSHIITEESSTFATPPNDVSFSTVGARSLWVWWNQPEVPATKYRVERSSTTGEGGPWVFISSETGTLFQDTGLTPLTTYSYRIGAINVLGLLTTGLPAATNGNRRDYSFVSSTITRHNAPILSGVAASSVAITWTWTDLSPGVTVTSYNLYTASEGVIAAGISASTTQWVENGLSGPNTLYTRLLRSVAADGEGDFTTASVYTLTNPPAAVVVTSSGLHTMSIGWAVDVSSGYRIDRSPDGLAWTGLRSWSDVHVSTWFNDSGLRYDATYYYAVSGYNHDGIISVSSAITSGDTTLPLPSTYTVLFATSVAAQSVSAPLAGVGQVAVLIPAGVVDGYFVISTSAETSPAEISKASLDAATDKLTNVTLLTGAIVELTLYNAYGQRITADLPAPARVTVTYIDADDDGVVDGTTIGETALKLFSLDTSALVWNRLQNSMLDQAGRTVYADLDHFSLYALGGITSAVGNLADMFAYPNPYRPGSGGNFDDTMFGAGIVFESLPARSKIKIYSLSGALVAEVSDDDGDGRCLWNAKNKDGSRAASGVYLYVVSADSGKKNGRIAIIR